MRNDLVNTGIGALALLVTALCITGWFTRNVDDPRRIVGWARSHGVAITDRNRALVTWWVGLSGTLRVVGGVSGMVLGSLFDDAFAVNTSAGPGFWVWVIIGWVAGGLWAWEVVTRQTDDGTRSASLLPRSTADYVPPAGRWAPTVAASLTVAILAAAPLLGPVTDAQGFPTPSTAEHLLIGAGAVILAVAARLALVHVVSRRQPTTDPEQVAVDDAIRATTTHLVSGGLTAAILLLAVQAAQMVLQPRHLPFGVRGWIPIVLLGGAWLSSTYLANRPWKVHRTVAT